MRHYLCFLVAALLLMSCERTITSSDKDGNTQLRQLRNPDTVDSYLVATIKYGAGYVAVDREGFFEKTPRGSQIEIYNTGKVLSKRFSEIKNLKTGEIINDVTLTGESHVDVPAVSLLKNSLEDFTFENDLEFVRETPECTLVTSPDGMTQSMECVSSCVADGGSVAYKVYTREAEDVIIYKNDNCGNYHIRKNREAVEAEIISLMEEIRIEHNRAIR